MGRVDVGEHDVAIRPRHDLLDLLDRGHDRRHRAGVLEVQARHLVPARAHRLERRLKGHRSRRDQRGVLAERVAHDEVRGDPVGAQQPRERHVHREHRGLGDLRAAQLLLGARDGSRVGRVGEDDVGQAAPLQQRRHDRVGLLEDLGHDRLTAAQVGEHVGVLGALARVEEGDLARRAAAAEDAAARAAPARRRGCRPAERAARSRPWPPARRRRRSRSQSARASAAAPRSAARGPGGAPGAPRPARCAARWPAKPRRRRRARAHRAAAPCPRSPGHVRERASRLGRARRARWGGRRRHVGRHGDRGVAVGAQSSGHVLLHDDVEVGPAEAEGAHAGDPGLAVGDLPLAQLGVDRERRGRPVDVRVGPLEVQARRQHLVVQGERGLEDARRPRGALQVADVGLHGPQRDRAPGELRPRERLGEAADLDDVAHACGRAVALHERALGGRQARVAPRALHGEALADRVGRGDALAPAVARPSDAAHDRVDAVAVALGVARAA